MLSPELQRLIDEAAIRDTLTRYARAVDLGDMAQLRAVFHDDAVDDHGDCQGPVENFLQWMAQRHATRETSMHFLGNVLIEFFSSDVALVETYFASRRIAARSVANHHLGGEAGFDEKLGRYVDRFERRAGAWRIAERRVVFDVMFTSTVRVDARRPPFSWTRKDGLDVFGTARDELVRRFTPA